MQFRHLKDVGLNYIQHFTTAMGISYTLITSGIASAIHAFYPDIFTHTASNAVRTLFREMKLKVVTPEDIEMRS